MKPSELIIWILVIFIIFLFALNKIEINGIVKIIKIQQDTINLMIKTQDYLLDLLDMIRNKNIYFLPKEDIYELS
jgi:hypothetical protein